MQAGGSYQPRPGTLPDRVLALLRARSPQPVSLVELRDTIGAGTLPPLLSKMIRAGVIKRSKEGFHLPALVPEGGPYAKAAPEPAPEPLPDHQRRLVFAIIRRAHAFRQGGAPQEAARLLRQAAGAHGLEARPAIRNDLLALADLFAAHAATYPEVDLRRAA